MEQANQKTQELLGESRLDLVLYCPHYGPVDGKDCDCKKPVPRMLLDALTALPGSTLDGAFVVGDNSDADGGAVAMLDLPYLDAIKFRRQPLEESLAELKKPAAPPTVDQDKVAGTLVGLAAGDALGAPVEFGRGSGLDRHIPMASKRCAHRGCGQRANIRMIPRWLC